MKAKLLVAVQLLILLLLILVALLLAGCSAPPAPVVQTRIQVQRVTIPPSLLSCAARPALNDWRTQADVGDYIVRLDEAYTDCANDVAAIAHIEALPVPAAP